MKRKFYFLLAIVAVAGALAFNGLTNYDNDTVSVVNISNIEALTMGENSQSPCKDCGNGCYTNEFYPWLREKD